MAGWRDRFAQPALFVAFAIVAASVASTFPHNANHQFMALLLLILIALVGRDEHEFEANANGALQAARWIAAIGLGWAGLMKLYYGYWFEAEFLAHRVAHDPGFARVLGLLIPGPELARLTGLGLEVGAGPFRAAAPLLVLISNLTWITECVLPIGFFFARTRLFSVLAAIAMMGVIQLAAREIFFGGLMLGLLLLYFEKDRVRPALPWIGLAYAAWMLRPELSLWLGSGGVT
jgi:hypothetical protein